MFIQGKGLAIVSYSSTVRHFVRAGANFWTSQVEELVSPPIQSDPQGFRLLAEPIHLQIKYIITHITTHAKNAPLCSAHSPDTFVRSFLSLTHSLTHSHTHTHTHTHTHDLGKERKISFEYFP